MRFSDSSTPPIAYVRLGSMTGAQYVIVCLPQLLGRVLSGHVVDSSRRAQR